MFKSFLLVMFALALGCFFWMWRYTIVTTHDSPLWQAYKLDRFTGKITVITIGDGRYVRPLERSIGDEETNLIFLGPSK